MGISAIKCNSRRAWHRRANQPEAPNGGNTSDEEENDASIIAEAALIGCGILLTADSHLLDAQENPDFRQTLKDCEVEGEALVIARPLSLSCRLAVAARSPSATSFRK